MGAKILNESQVPLSIPMKGKVIQENKVQLGQTE
jgi:hypothetical protein